MGNNNGRNRSRQQCIRNICEKADTNFFFNAITDDGMLDKLESLLPEYRERIYTRHSHFPCSLHALLMKTVLVDILSMIGLWLDRLQDLAA